MLQSLDIQEILQMISVGRPHRLVETFVGSTYKSSSLRKSEFQQMRPFLTGSLKTIPLNDIASILLWF